MFDTLVIGTTTAQRWMDGDQMDGWGWWWMGLGMLLVLAVVVALVFFLVRESGRRGSSHDRVGARDALDHRFARGEIDEDEYKTRRDILNG